MRWPLVSRRAYDLMLDALERERRRSDGLVDQLVRIQRREVGLPENTPIRHERAERNEEMPDRLARYIASIGSREMRLEAERVAKRKYREGESWDSISAMIPQREAAP